MISNKLSQLKQDINEVNGAVEELEPYLMTGGLEKEYKDLKDKFEMLEDHLKDHIENVEIFIGRIN